MLLDNPYRPDQRPKREIETLVDAGWDVVLLCEKAQGLFDVVKEGRLEIRRVDAPWRGSVVSMTANAKQAKFISYIQKEWADGFDVVHCHDWLTLPVGAQIAEVLGAPLVYDSHEYFAGMTGPGKRVSFRARLRQWIRLRREGRALRCVDLLITVSPLISAWLRERRGFKGNIATIRNMPDWPDPPTPDLSIRSRFQVPSDAVLLVHCGNIRLDSRRLDVVIAAIAEIDGCHLLCVGDGEVDRLMELANDACVESRIHHLPAVPHSELGGVLAACDLGLSVLQSGVPHLDATLPNKVFEYLLAGVPVISSPSQCQSQYLCDEGVGWSMTELSPTSCAEIIRVAISELSLVRGRVVSRPDRFAWASQEHLLLNAYKELLEGKNSDPTQSMARPEAK